MVSLLVKDMLVRYRYVHDHAATALVGENLTCTSAAIGCSDAQEFLLLPDEARFVFFLVAGMVAQQ